MSDYSPQEQLIHVANIALEISEHGKVLPPDVIKPLRLAINNAVADLEGGQS